MNKCILKQQLHVARAVMGKHITSKLLDCTCLFLFPCWTSKSSLELHPLVCSGLLTPDTSIKSGDIAPKGRVGTDAGGTSANLRLNSDHSWQHHSFFKSVAINVAWNCNVISPNGTSVWKSATVKVDTDILSSNDWQASWHIVASNISTQPECRGHFYFTTVQISSPVKHSVLFPCQAMMILPAPGCLQWKKKKKGRLCNIRQIEMTLRKSKATLRVEALSQSLNI